MATARRIEISLPYKVLLEAELLNEEPDQFARTLSLGAVVREASTLNLDLLAADKRVSAGEESVRESRSPLLPQVNLFGGLSVVDADRARVFPTIGEKEWAANLEASQLLYSDRAWANYSIEKSFQDQRLEERAQLRLDVIEEAARSYLDLLRGGTISQIQKDNLNLTRSNLELASSRVEIGVAGREELFRWQSQLATNQRSVVTTEAARNQARIAVNRVLNRPLNEVFGTVEASLNDPQFVASFEALGPYIDNPRGFSLFAEFMTGEAIAAAPELAQFDAAIRARERELKSVQRSFFLPDFSLNGGVKAFNVFGEGSELPDGLNNTDWFVSLNASIPLFRGGERFAKVNRVKLQLQELSLQRDAASQRVEQRMRSLLEAANASYLGIDLSRAQAEAARENLLLVTDSYAAGVVGILALLDAQNEALVAELVSANAVFEYVSDLMSVQRAVGRFDYFRTPSESQAFLSRLGQFYQERGVRVRNP
jgi:outer membrane protein TolC